LSRECPHYDKHCRKIIFFENDEYTLCQKCAEKEVFSNQKYVKSKIEFHRTPDEIIEDLHVRIRHSLGEALFFQEMIRKQEKLK